MFKTSVAMMTDRGLNPNRPVNQDYGVVIEPPPADPRASRGHLYAVADGMGGAAGGEVASKLAVGTLADQYYRTSWQGPLLTLRAAFQAANQAVYSRAQSDPALTGMGSTLTALVLIGEQGYVAHVGDTRCYLLRDGNLSAVTQDHSQVAEQVRKGLLSPEQAKVSPDRNLITRVVGDSPNVEVDSNQIAVRLGDVFLLSSDGVHGELPDDAIRSVLSSRPPPEAAARLLTMVKAVGAPDDATAVVVSLGSGRPVGRKRVGRAALYVGIPVLAAVVLALLLAGQAGTNAPATMAKKDLELARAVVARSGAELGSPAYAAYQQAESAYRRRAYNEVRRLVGICIDQANPAQGDTALARLEAAYDAKREQARALNLAEIAPGYYAQAEEQWRKAQVAKAAGQLAEAREDMRRAGESMSAGIRASREKPKSTVQPKPGALPNETMRTTPPRPETARPGIQPGVTPPVPGHGLEPQPTQPLPETLREPAPPTPESLEDVVPVPGGSPRKTGG